MGVRVRVTTTTKCLKRHSNKFESVAEETLEQIWVSGLPAKMASQVVTDAVATVMVIVADVEAVSQQQRRRW